MLYISILYSEGSEVSVNGIKDVLRDLVIYVECTNTQLRYGPVCLSIVVQLLTNILSAKILKVTFDDFFILSDRTLEFLNKGSYYLNKCLKEKTISHATMEGHNYCLKVFEIAEFKVVLTLPSRRKTLLNSKLSWLVCTTKCRRFLLEEVLDILDEMTKLEPFEDDIELTNEVAAIVGNSLEGMLIRTFLLFRTENLYTTQEMEKVVFALLELTQQKLWKEYVFKDDCLQIYNMFDTKA